VSALSVTLVAWCTSVPWGLFVFQQFTPIALIANLVAIPISFVNLALGFIAVLCAAFGPVTPLLNRINAECAGVLLSFIRWASEVPGGHFQLPQLFKQRPSLVIFDFAEGGAVLLREGASHWLLDCGNERRAETTLSHALKAYGIQSLDTLVLSHGDSEHIGGALSVCETFKPTRVVDSPLTDRSKIRFNIQEWLNACSLPVLKVVAGTTLKHTEKLRCEVLHPPKSLKATLADDKTLVTRWQTKDWSILYTADAGLPTELWLLEHCHDALKSDLWIRGTHAREMTGSDEFVRAVSPRLVVIAGAPMSPHRTANQEWAKRWRSEGIEVWLQEETGAVEGWSGDRIKIQSFIGKESVTLTPQSAFYGPPSVH
jgi:beta-lactamase superfamily II metal-dependent hydrolase